MLQFFKKYFYTAIFFILGFISGIYIGSEYLPLSQRIKTLLYNWQELIGAFLGSLVAASIAVLIFVLTERKKSEDKRREHLHLLHRSTGAALSNLLEIDASLRSVIEYTIPKVVERLDANIRDQNDSINAAFIPLQHVFEMNEVLLHTFSGSGYIDAKTIHLINRSKDCRKMVDDIDRQFERTFLHHSQIVLAGRNQDPRPANLRLRQSMLDFSEFIKTQVMGNNIPKYAKELVQAQVAVGRLIEWGPKRWQAHFKNITTPDTAFEDIDKYFAQEANARIEQIQPAFKSIIEKIDVK